MILIVIFFQNAIKIREGNKCKQIDMFHLLSLDNCEKILIKK